VNKFAIALGALLVGACATDPPDTNAHQANNVSAGPPKDGVIAPSGGSVRAPYQVKSTAEIATAIEACFGKGLTTVSASMIQTVENPSGFLSARQFSADSDVVSGEASIIDGDPSVERTGVRNATLSLPILAALQDIGNVVGENCAAARDTNASCDCATKESAHAMLSRCLPSIAPSQYAGLENDFAEMCAKDPAVAISSLLASTAFGVR
jgi:hypothetical protein